MNRFVPFKECFLLKKCNYLLILLFLFFHGCQSYTQKQRVMQKEFSQGHWDLALQALEESGLGSQSQNYVLYRMEKGMIQYVSEFYAEPVTLWNEASRKVDDLYTLSLSKTAESFVINDASTDYRGEAHERVLLPIFSSLDLFAQNNSADAAVMIRRAWEVLDDLKSENEGKNIFKYDAFSYYFAGMVFEARGDWDSAIVAYRNARDHLSSHDTGAAVSAQASDEIAKALGRLSEYRNRKEILADLKKTNPSLTWQNQKKFNQQGEVYVIHEVGLSPMKVPKEFFIPTGDSQVVRVSFPEYRNISYLNKSSRVFLNNQLVGQPIMMEDIGLMARQALEDRRLWDFARMAARAVLKDSAAKNLGEHNAALGVAANVFGVVTEVADTRSWTTLPDNIQVLRVLVPAGVESTVQVKPLYGQPQTWTLTLKPGEKRLIRLRTVD